LLVLFLFDEWEENGMGKEVPGSRPRARFCCFRLRVRAQGLVP